AGHRRIVDLGDGDRDAAGVALEVVGAVGGAVVADRVVEDGRRVKFGHWRIWYAAGCQVKRAVGVRGRGDGGHGQRLRALVGRAGRVVVCQACGRAPEPAVFPYTTLFRSAGHRRIVDLGDGDRDAAGVALEVVGAVGGAVVADR